MSTTSIACTPESKSAAPSTSPIPSSLSPLPPSLPLLLSPPQPPPPPNKVPRNTEHVAAVDPIVYAPGQWSPLHTDGERRYTRDQLHQMSQLPLSRVQPPCSALLGAMHILVCAHRMPNISQSINLMPLFARKSMQQQQQHQHHHQHQHPPAPPQQQQQQQQRRQQQQQSQSQHGHHQYHSAQQQQQNSGGGGRKNQRGGRGGTAAAKNKSMDAKDAKPEVMHISLATKDDVQLNQSDNAWKPRVMVAASAAAAAAERNPQHDTDELYRRVRSILNKLTFENFDVLLEQLKNFAIDTMDKLNGVILLVFDKAIDEPKFSRAYAQLCKSLVENCFPVDAEGNRKLFKTTLINKCQGEFERNVVSTDGSDGSNAAALQPMRAELAECTEPERRTELRAMLVEREQRLRTRTVCTVGFIGELYRMDMLTTKIMGGCVRSLLDSRSEEKLECLCRLLATVGAKMEHRTGDAEVDAKQYLDLTEYFAQLKRIVDQKQAKLKVSNRVRFMLLDTIDLRSNNWVSRRN